MKASRRRILVTGGAGFIGAAVSKALLVQGHAVTVLDNLERGAPKNLGHALDQIEMINADIRDRAAVMEAVQGKETVFHLAYINGTRHFYEQPDLVLDVGVRGMINMIDALEAASIQDFFLASSSEVYQTPATIPTDEQAPLSIPDPRNPRYSYGGGKITCELMTLHWAKKFVDRTIIFRPHNVYGFDMGPDHVIPELSQKLVAAGQKQGGDNIDLQLKGDGSATRAFIHIDDFTRAITLLLAHGHDGEIYHIGTSEEVSIAHLAHEIGACLGYNINLVSGPTPTGETPRRAPDIRLMRSLGFSPEISLGRGVKRYVEDYLASL